MSSDLDALTWVVYGEARNQSDEGQSAVAWVVINRTKKSKNSIKYEATKKSQFCCYSGTMKEEEARKKAESIAKNAIDGKSQDPTGGATHFCSTSMKDPWGVSPCITIGDHKFYKGIAPYK